MPQKHHWTTLHNFAVSFPIIGGHKCCALITWKSYFCTTKEAQSSFLARKRTGHKLLCKSRFREEAPLLSEPWGRTECIHKIKRTWLCYSPPVICGDINMNTRHGCWSYKAYANYTEYLEHMLKMYCVILQTCIGYTEKIGAGRLNKDTQKVTQSWGQTFEDSALLLWGPQSWGLLWKYWNVPRLF